MIGAVVAGGSDSRNPVACRPRRSDTAGPPARRREWFAGQNCAASVAADRSSASGGRIRFDTDVGSSPFTCRVPWYDPKKNSLFFLTAPPAVAPNWFCFRFGFGCPVALRKNALALKTSLRRNSHRLPWKLVLAALRHEVRVRNHRAEHGIVLRSLDLKLRNRVGIRHRARRLRSVNRVPARRRIAVHVDARRAAPQRPGVVHVAAEPDDIDSTCVKFRVFSGTAVIVF